MTIRERTALQEKSWNATHTSALIQVVQLNVYI